jgi:fibro-slime domain-containing protein
VAAGADKVLILFDPWSNVSLLAPVAPQIFVNENPVAQPSFVPDGPSWWSYDFGTATAVPSQFTIHDTAKDSTGNNWHEYLSQGTNSQGQGVGVPFSSTLFANHDTVWLVPNPLQGGPPLAFYSQPQQTTILFWNPWEGTQPGQDPSVKVDTMAFSPMSPVAGQPGWYSQVAVGFTHLDLTFKSATGSQSLGAQGLVAGTSAAPVRFDSLLSRNDTVWVFQDPLPSGPPVGEASAPRGVVLDLFNPWDGLFPVVFPVARFADGYAVQAQPVLARCGWFQVVRYDLHPTSVLFSGSATTWGTGGSGSNAPFDLTGALAVGDTVRIGPDSTGRWLVGSAWTTATGQCALYQLPATIRDFDSTHPAFEHYYGCGVTHGMVFPTLGADNTPVWDSLNGNLCGDSTLHQWFHNEPNLEYTTCVDIPLTLDPATDVYSYDNQDYFPIDTIPKSVDPHNIQYIAQDGKMHNFNFCLEAHAVFDYHPGQTFDFIGDDDVWAFINKKLVVDLGGVHNAAEGAVALDTLGLVPGKTYPFDFFFCERHTVTSHMKISTSLNLRDIPSYSIVRSDPSPGVQVFDLSSALTKGQGCSSTQIDKAAAGRYLLSGAGLGASVYLPLGTSFGGLVVRGDTAEIRVDSATMQGLIPGTYMVRVQVAADSTQFQFDTFVVPVSGKPVFVSHTVLSGSVGSTFETDVEEVQNGAVVQVPQPFRLRPLTGILWCADSACARVLGPADTLMTGAGGTPRKVWVRDQVQGSYSLVVQTIKGDSSDVRLAVFFGTAPDSAVWTNPDGNGTADHVEIWLHQKWTPQSQIRVSWPDTSFWIGPNLPGLVVSPDSMVLNLDVPGGRPGTAAYTTLLGSWSSDGISWQPFQIRDGVPPVPTKAILSWGSTFDTLRVWPSEPIQSFKTGDDVLRRRAPDGSLPVYDFTQESLDPATGVLVLVFPDSASPIPHPGDSVRFPPNGKSMDIHGNAPGLLSKSVIILGTDRPPYDAVMLDANGDGRADEVVLRFTQPLVYGENWIFRWPSDSGTLDIRLSVTDSAQLDSGGRIVTFHLPPYDFGSTSCPTSGCGDLGSMVATAGTDSAVTNFPIRDGVPPIPLRGTLHYSGLAGVPDTLTAYFSEPVVVGTDTSGWIAWGAMVPGSMGNPLHQYPVTLDSTGRIATFLVDTFVVPVPGNGIRMDIPGAGGLLDSSGNGAGDTAAWGPLVLGPVPPHLGLVPYRTTVKWNGQAPPATEPALQVLVSGGTGGGNWHTLDGSPLPDTSQMVLVLFQMNGPTDAAVYVYDNSGVFVAYQNLGAVKQAYLDGAIQTDSRGNYEVMVGWDGKAARGMAPSGVYLMRMVGWRTVGNRPYIEQKLVQLGWIVR